MASSSCSVGFLASLLVAVVACDLAEPGNENEGGAAECCDAQPVCPINAHEVDACLSDECFTESACCQETLCEPGMCTADRCGPNETEVDSCSFSEHCWPVDLCGLTIYCDSFCSAVAECDGGDDPLVAGVCPEGSVCYMVEACGTTAECVDHGQPHGCPTHAPVEMEPCSSYGIACKYPNRALGCRETWTCQDPPEVGAPVVIDPWVWHLTESTCALAD